VHADLTIQDYLFIVNSTKRTCDRVILELKFASTNLLKTLKEIFGKGLSSGNAVTTGRSANAIVIQMRVGRL